MHRVALALLVTTSLATVATVAEAAQMQRHAPARYVLQAWEVIHSNGEVRAEKRTTRIRHKEGSLDPAGHYTRQRGVLPGEWYGPVVVHKHVDHISWAGSYRRQDGQLAGNVYEVEIEELRPVSPIRGNHHEVEIRMRLVKRAPLFQPNLDGGE